MFRRRFIAPMLITLCLLMAALPVAHASQTPEEVVGAYLRYFQERRWIMAAELMDPDVLNSFKQLMVEMVNRIPEGDPEEKEFMAMLLGPGSTRAQLRDADPASLLAGILRFGTTMAGMSVVDGQVLGAVYETPELAHVVTRSTVLVYGQFPVTSVEVVSVAQTPDGWRISDMEEVDSMIQMMQRLAAGM